MNLEKVVIRFLTFLKLLTFLRKFRSKSENLGLKLRTGFEKLPCKSDCDSSFFSEKFCIRKSHFCDFFERFWNLRFFSKINPPNLKFWAQSKTTLSNWNNLATSKFSNKKVMAFRKVSFVLLCIFEKSWLFSKTTQPKSISRVQMRQQVVGSVCA